MLDTAGVQCLGAAQVVAPEGVAAVDDDVAGREPLAKARDCCFRRLAGGQHDPDRARRVEAGDQVVEIAAGGRSIARQRLAGSGVLS